MSKLLVRRHKCIKTIIMKILLISVVVMLVSCNAIGDFEPSDDILVNISRLIYQIQSLPDKVNLNFFKPSTRMPQPAITHFDGSGMDIIFHNRNDAYYNIMIFGLSVHNHVCPSNKQLVYTNLVNVWGGDVSTGSETVNSTKPVQEVGVVVLRQTDKIDPVSVRDYLSDNLTPVSCVSLDDYSARFNLVAVAGTYLTIMPNMYL